MFIVLAVMLLIFFTKGTVYSNDERKTKRERKKERERYVILVNFFANDHNPHESSEKTVHCLYLHLSCNKFIKNS